MTDTKELIEELRAQANQHPCDADLTQFDIAATVIEQLQNSNDQEYERLMDLAVKAAVKQTRIDTIREIIKRAEKHENFTLDTFWEIEEICELYMGEVVTND